MSDVFISYAREDREKARALAEILRSRGVSVWWDDRLVAGNYFEETIEKELGDSKCVVVLWSNDSRSSHWVKVEAAEGRDRGILVPVLIGKTEIPLAYRGIQAVDLSDWHDAPEPARLSDLFQSIQPFIRTETPVAADRDGVARSTKARVSPAIDLWNSTIGKYRFLRPIDLGRRASVWLAEEVDARGERVRSVAVKVLVEQPGTLAWQSGLGALRRSLPKLQELAAEFPIIRCHEVLSVDAWIDDQGRLLERAPERTAENATPAIVHLVVMDYADGGSLDETYRECVIKSKGGEHLGHFVGVCRSLQAMHGVGVVHQDIRPKNLLWMRAANTVKLADVGLASFLGSAVPSAEERTLSLHYLAPEAFDQAAAPSSERDVYALGCTLFEIFTGKLAIDPEWKSGLDSYRLEHLDAPRPDPHELRPQLVSRELGGTIRDMMHVEPSKRPSLTEVIGALQAETRRMNGSPAERFDATEQSVHYGSHLVHPTFHVQYLDESIYFVFLEHRASIHGRVRGILALLHSHFGGAFSFHQVFGRYAMVIRVWAREIAIIELCETLIGEFLDGDRSAMKLFSSRNVLLPGHSLKPLPDGLSAAEVRSKLEAAQGEEGATAAAAVRWLSKNGVYLRQRPLRPSKSQVRCLCLLASATGSSYADSPATFSLVKTVLEEKLDTQKTHMTLYRRSGKVLGGFDREPSSVVLTYYAPNFEDVPVVPSLLNEELRSQRLTCSSLLASTRLGIESSLVHLRPAIGIRGD